jgi:hypothetical protein
MVAGHAPWDIPKTVSNELFGLNLPTNGQGDVAAVDGFTPEDGAGTRQGNQSQDAEDPRFKGMARSVSHSSILATSAAAGSSKIVGRDTAKKHLVHEPMDAIVARIAKNGRIRLPALLTGPKRSNSESTAARTAAVSEKRTASALTTVLRAVVHDNDETVHILQRVAAESAEAAAADLAKTALVPAKQAAPGTRRGSTGATPVKSDAAHSEKHEKEAAGSSELPPGFGPSTSAHPHIQDVELLAHTLAQLAGLLVERLNAYYEFIRMQAAAEAAEREAAAEAEVAQAAAAAQLAHFMEGGNWRTASVTGTLARETKLAPSASMSRLQLPKLKTAASSSNLTRTLSTAFPPANPNDRSKEAAGAVFEIQPQNM